MVVVVLMKLSVPLDVSDVSVAAEARGSRRMVGRRKCIVWLMDEKEGEEGDIIVGCGSPWSGSYQRWHRMISSCAGCSAISPQQFLRQE